MRHRHREKVSLSVRHAVSRSVSRSVSQSGSTHGHENCLAGAQRAHRGTAKKLISAA